MPNKLDTRKIVAYFGGRTPCHTLLTQAGFEVSKKTIEKWQERGSIPLARLLQLAEADRLINKRTFDFTKFITK